MKCVIGYVFMPEKQLTCWHWLEHKVSKICLMCFFQDSVSWHFVLSITKHKFCSHHSFPLFVLQYWSLGLRTDSLFHLNFYLLFVLPCAAKINSQFLLIEHFTNLFKHLKCSVVANQITSLIHDFSLHVQSPLTQSNHSR